VNILSFSIGTNYKITFFGESHGRGIGVVIEGLKAGRLIDINRIEKSLLKRVNSSPLNSQRKESEELQILSGLFNGRTNGGPLTFYIENGDIDSKVYSNGVPRPSHSDYPAFVKYEGFNDYRGGGFFSGRLTALFIIAGEIARIILEEKGIYINSQILQIGELIDKKVDPNNLEDIEKIITSDLPILNLEKEFNEYISKIKAEGDSVGSKVFIFIRGLELGVGEPYFRSVESVLSSLIFSIPGVKAVEFGLGEEFSRALGSNVNDMYSIRENIIRTNTNYNGGILGGITNGETLEAFITFKPTPSIQLEQESINIQTNENVILKINGRHDPVLAYKGYLVLESVSAIGILDLLMERNHDL
jgi:chorismate synthase